MRKNKMIVGSALTRAANSSGDLAAQEWQQMGYAFYVWNSAAERIELFNIGTAWGPNTAERRSAATLVCD